jgi:hypothetical protein
MSPSAKPTGAVAAGGRAARAARGRSRVSRKSPHVHFTTHQHANDHVHVHLTNRQDAQIASHSRSDQIHSELLCRFACILLRFCSIVSKADRGTIAFLLRRNYIPHQGAPPWRAASWQAPRSVGKRKGLLFAATP